MSMAAPRFSYYSLNMDWTLHALQEHPDDDKWFQIAQKIAQVTLVPILLLASLEAILKNGYFFIANLAILSANWIWVQNFFGLTPDVSPRH